MSFGMWVVSCGEHERRLCRQRCSQVANRWPMVVINSLQPDYGPAAVIGTIPILLIFITLQRWLPGCRAEWPEGLRSTSTMVGETQRCAGRPARSMLSLIGKGGMPAFRGNAVHRKRDLPSHAAQRGGRADVPGKRFAFIRAPGGGTPLTLCVGRRKCVS